MSKNYYSWNPILKLEVSGIEEYEYELDKLDILEVFKRYGKVVNVEV